jgi:hypothetical protein
MLSAFTGASCRASAKSRGGPGGARRDLEDLRAAINHHAKEGLHRGEVRVVLPAKGAPRERWLTRSEAAKLLWTCWRHREVQTAHRGSLRGQKIETDKRPLRHLARFILIGLYTGTRASAIASASPRREEGRSFVDLDAGIFYRLAQGRRATNKRQPPVTPSVASPHEAMGAPWHCQASLRRMARQAGVVGQDRVPNFCSSSAAFDWGRQHHAAHAPPHGRNLADTERRADVGCGRIFRNERKNVARRLRPSSP